MRQDNPLLHACDGEASIEHRFGFNGMDAVWVDVPATFLIYKDGTGVADLRVEGEIASW